MNQKYKHKNMCILLLLFLTFPISCMLEDSIPKETNQESNRKRKREADTPEEPSKRKKRRFGPGELLSLWLRKKTSQCKDYVNLSDDSLAVLLEFCDLQDPQQSIAERVYTDQIDPIFIAKLLCEHNTKPERVYTHLRQPNVIYSKNTVLLRCNRRPRCNSTDEFPIAAFSDVHIEGSHRLRASLYHAWTYIKAASRRNTLTPPTLVLKETNGDLVTAHENKEVYRWPVGHRFAQNKEMFTKKLSLQEVLLLKHMQRTHDPLNQEKEQLDNQASRDTLEQLQGQARSLPSRLRAILREKEKEEADNEEV